MKQIVFVGHAFRSPESDVIHNAILELCNNELVEQIEVVYCGGAGLNCVANPLKLKPICELCKIKGNQFFEHVIKNAKYKQVSRSYLTLQEEIAPPEFNDNLKEITYEKSDLGYAILSTYISLTRDYEPNLNNKYTKKLLSDFAITYKCIFDYFYKNIKKKGFKELHLFNGRLNNTRAAFRAAQSLGCATFCHEINGPTDNVVVFKDALPHDIRFNETVIENLYHTYREDAEHIAREFYDKKKRGLAVNDRSYVGKQKKGKLPSCFNKSNHNIVIFTSSEDEFKAIGKEWENTLFDSQIEGITYISKAAEQDSSVKIYVRIHPNTASIHRKYKKKLNEINKLDVEVISATSTISSYDLLIAADLVVSFGSTIGIEAVYWDKPSILIGNTYYQNLNATYNPESLNELTKLLITKLIPKSKEGAIKMALFWTKNGVKAKYFSLSRKNKYLFMGENVNNDIYTLRYIAQKIYEKLYLKFMLG